MGVACLFEELLEDVSEVTTALLGFRVGGVSVSRTSILIVSRPMIDCFVGSVVPRKVRLGVWM